MFMLMHKTFMMPFQINAISVRLKSVQNKICRGPVGILLWGFLNGCMIKRKRVKHAINVVVDV